MLVSNLQQFLVLLLPPLRAAGLSLSCRQERDEQPGGDGDSCSRPFKDLQHRAARRPARGDTGIPAYRSDPRLGACQENTSLQGRDIHAPGLRRHPNPRK